MCQTKGAPAHMARTIESSPRAKLRSQADEYDVYHVNDFMRKRGWRLNGQQHPNSLHMAVTGPQTQPGVADTFASDLADAVTYALEHRNEPARSSAVYGAAGASPEEADATMRMLMASNLDLAQAVPPMQ